MKDFSFYDRDDELKCKIHDAIEHAMQKVHDRAKSRDYKIFHINKLGYVTSLCFHIRNYLGDEWFFNNRVYMMLYESYNGKKPDIGFYVEIRTFLHPLSFVEVKYKNVTSKTTLTSIEHDMKKLHNYKELEAVDTYFIAYISKDMFSHKNERFSKMLSAIKSNYFIHSFDNEEQNLK